jgi:plastocyanin
MLRWFRAGLILLSLCVATAALASSITISQKDRKFTPGELHVAAGTTLHIINDDKVTHHIYVDSPTMKFDSGEQPVGTSVDLVFNTKGSFTVLCAIHPTMHLKVTVQ